MKLTSRSDYAFRMLLFLAAAPEGRGTVRAVADAYGLSRDHLAKVAQQLARLGWIETSTGRSGGLLLTVDPAALTVGDVIRATEEDVAVVECLGPGNTCCVSGLCGAQGVFRQAVRAFFAELDAHTLADVAANRAGLQAALRLGPTQLVAQAD